MLPGSDKSHPIWKRLYARGLTDR
ncbi:protein of unknown function [Burkholderia multivorans]